MDKFVNKKIANFIAMEHGHQPVRTKSDVPHINHGFANGLAVCLHTVKGKIEGCRAG